MEQSPETQDLSPEPSSRTEGAVDIQRRFNDLRGELLDYRANLVNWWLTAIGVVAPIAALIIGILGYERFSDIESDARQSVEAVGKIAEEIKADRDKGKEASRTGEGEENASFCSSLGGDTEVRHAYTYPAGTGYIQVDCETADTVYEGGLDRRSSLDSVQQALFAAHLTGKQPAVVIYNTDGKIGRYEHRIKVACERAGVAFHSVP